MQNVIHKTFLFIAFIVIDLAQNKATRKQISSCLIKSKQNEIADFALVSNSILKQSNEELEFPGDVYKENYRARWDVS